MVERRGLIFACDHNAIRSPIAESLFLKYFPKFPGKLESGAVKSTPYPWLKSEAAIALARIKCTPIHAHFPTLIGGRDLAGARLVLCFEDRQVEDLLRRYKDELGGSGDQPRRVMTIPEYAGHPTVEILDPDTLVGSSRQPNLLDRVFKSQSGRLSAGIIDKGNSDEVIAVYTKTARLIERYLLEAEDRFYEDFQFGP